MEFQHENASNLKKGWTLEHAPFPEAEISFFGITP